MHDVSAVWQQIYAQPDHRKETAVTVNGVEYYENRILNTAPSVSGKLFDAPSVGNARSRTLTLNLMPYDGPQGYISPLSEIRLYVRLKSADGQSVSEWIPKGVFYADEIKRDSDTGATRITAFDAIMKMERQFGNAVCRITFDDGLGGIQRFIRQIGDAMPTPDTPTHEGERFSAWYPNPADTETVVRDMLFTAEWARKFTVTFDSGSGTPQTFSVFSGDATPTPTTPTKEGYTFMGWTPTPAATVTADALYFAQWDEVEITTYPEKLDYGVGDELDYTGLVITETLPDGTTRDITPYCTFDPTEGTEVTEIGTIPVTVSYNGEPIITFEVEVEAGVIASGDWWTLYDNGLLNIFCIGDMPDYSGNNSAPWYAYRSNITNATISSSVTSVGDYAFYGCANLTNVTIPASVTSIGNAAFTSCSGLASVTIPNSVTSIGSYAFSSCTSLTSVTIPASVTEIGGLAFNRCASLTSVEIPNGVTSIKFRTFSGCTSLTSVTIPNSVTTIGADAFYGCSGLTSVTIPSSVTEIGQEAFYSCANLPSVTMPNSVTSIGGSAFGACTSLTSVTISNSVTAISNYEFYGCSSLMSVTIPNSVTTISNYAFRECSELTNVTIPDSVTTISNYAFSKCTSLTSVTIPNSVTTLDNSAFGGCTSLTSVTIPASVTSIGSGVFAGCTNLTSVTIPASVTSIKGSAFNNCSSLTDVYYSGTQAQWQRIDIDLYNWNLTSATIHYNSSGPS